MKEQIPYSIRLEKIWNTVFGLSISNMVLGPPCTCDDLDPECCVGVCSPGSDRIFDELGGTDDVGGNHIWSL